MTTVSETMPLHHAAGRVLTQNAYGTRLLVTVIFLPMAAIILTVGFFVLSGVSRVDGFYAPLWGLGAALVLWLLVSALLTRDIARPEHAIPSSYGELQQRRDQLAVIIENAPKSGVAYREASKHLIAIDEQLRASGVQWVLARGYCNVWDRLYRAEEATLEFIPLESVLEAAYYDELRLDGSTIPNRDHLLAKLRTAVEVIDPDAVRYLKTGATTQAQALAIRTMSMPEGTVGTAYEATLEASGGTPPYKWASSDLDKAFTLSPQGVVSGTPHAGAFRFTSSVTDASGTTVTKPFLLTVNAQAGLAPAPSGIGGAVALARSALRNVRGAVNEYKDQRWNGLIVARNRMIATFGLTAITVFLLLALAIVGRASISEVIAAGVFWLIGATIGLGKRLRDESQADSAFEDYGLSAARLVTIPLFSGIAAVCGVLLIAMLPLTRPMFGPTGDDSKRAAASVARTNEPAEFDLHATFDVQQNPIGLFIAALFGLTPGLLFDGLKQQADKLKAELQSTTASGAAPQT